MLHVLENLTDEQRKILKQFRLRLEDVLTSEDTDYRLTKFLRAKNFDLNAAVKIFKENYYNRVMFGVDTILDTYKKPEVVEKYEATGMLGYAKDGSLIRYIAFGQLDFYGFIMSLSCLDLCLYFSYLIESDRKMMKEESRKTKKDIEEITFIMDLDGFTIQKIMHKNVIEMGLDYTRLAQDCYPEIWSHILVVNAPKIFDAAFYLFKPVMRSAIFERTYIVDKASTKDLLLKYIDENVLPAFLGGKRVDSNGDPWCKEFITFGGKVPEKLYGQNTRIPLSLSDPRVKFVNIRPRSIVSFNLAVREANAKIRLQIESENGSIYLSVWFREFGSDPHDIERTEEYESLSEIADDFRYKQISVEIRAQVHCAKEDALCTLQWPGIYAIRLNNSSNWFTSRRLLLKYDLFPSSKEE